MKKAKKIFLLFFSFAIFGIFVPGSTSKAATVFNFQSDYFQKVFSISLNDGGGLFGEDKDYRLKLNTNILNEKNEQKKVSLYDRFGGKLSFIPYFGEQKFDNGLIDKVYTQIKANGSLDDINLTFDDLFGTATSSENHIIYSTRPDIISNEEFNKRGYYDPRRAQYNSLSGTGGEATLGNFYLGISNTITQVVTYFSGPKIFNIAYDVAERVFNSKEFKSIVNSVKWLLWLLVIGAAFSFFRSLVKFTKGQKSIYKIAGDFISYVLSLGLIYAFLNQPAILLSTTKTIITGIDNILVTSLKATNDSEVSNSDRNDDVITAMIWHKTVLDKWSEGMFGEKYDHMYTMYDETHKYKWIQSDDDISSAWSDGSVKYNSKEATGDIKVPLSDLEKDYVRNWAALAWSTQSKYHLNAVPTDKTSNFQSKVENGVSFPVATLSPNNTNLYIDNFRWIDAKLNISYQYTEPGKYTGDMLKSYQYTQNFVQKGFESLWLSILLFPILLVLFKKLASLMVMLSTTVVIIYNALRNIASPDNEETHFLRNIKNLWTYTYYYIWWTFTVYIMFVMYLVMIDKGFISQILWIFLAMVIYINSKPIQQFPNIKRTLNEFKYQAKYRMKQAYNKIKR